ncbi:hypothetical protein PO124_01035 [Bacillus licheniformis]|nr:hypothetical protein [Bacillus licheniformis]
MIDEDSEIVTVIKGEDAPEEEAEELAAYISETYEDVEVEVHDGNSRCIPTFWLSNNESKAEGHVDKSPSLLLAF